MHRGIFVRLRWILFASVVATVAIAPIGGTAHGEAHGAGVVNLTWEVPNGTFWPPIATLVIREYTKRHPNVQIKLQQIDGNTYNQKLFIQASAGTLPDIIETSDGQNVYLAAHHIALDMQPLVNQDPGYNIGDIYPNFLDLGRLPGQNGLYMIPMSADAVVTFYNKDMFKAAGVPFPRPNWTYAQFLDAAQKLTKRDSSGRITQWGLDFGPFWWATVMPWLSGFGGSALTPDGKQTSFSSPGSVKGWQAIQDLYIKYRVAVPPTVQLPGGAFFTGKAAMSLGVHAGVPGFTAAIGKKFHWDAQEMPSFPGGRHVNGMGTAGFAVSTNSHHRAEAWDVVKFVGSVEGQRALGASGGNVPVRKSMINDPVWRSFPLNNDAFIKAIKYGILPPQLPTDAALNCGTVYTGIFNTATTNAFDKIIRGAPVAPAAKAADQQINGCVASLGQ